MNMGLVGDPFDWVSLEKGGTPLKGFPRVPWIGLDLWEGIDEGGFIQDLWRVWMW